MMQLRKFNEMGRQTVLCPFTLALALICLSVSVQAQDFIRIKSRWQKDGKTDYRIHIQNPVVDAGATDMNWWSAQWTLEQVPGTDFYRIKNRWQKDNKTTYYLHNQNGKIEAGAAEPGWWSAMWSLEKVDESFYRIKNRWKPDQYLNIQGPALAVGPIEPNWWSAMWELEGFKGNSTPDNTQTNADIKRAPITGVGFGALPTPAEDLAFVRKATQVNAPAGFGAGASSSSMPKTFVLDMPPIGSQGNEGSCVAWACGYALKSFEMKKATGIPHTISGTNVMNIIGVASPEYLFNRINLDNNKCLTGSYFVGSGTTRGALDLLKTEGVVSWLEMPYSDKNGCGTVENTKEPVSPNAAANRIKNYVKISDLSETSLKTLLTDQHPIVFAALPSDAFMSAGPGFVWRSEEGPWTRGHAMVIIGFDDAKKAYKVQNSWGTGWGDNGYTWLDYEFAKTAIKEAYVTYSDNLDHFKVETPGYVTVYSEAGYVAWCKLSYTLPSGERKVIEENLSLFFTFKKVIPPGSTNITLEAGGYAVLDPLNIKLTWPTATVQACYKIWGTIFDTEYAAINCAY